MTDMELIASGLRFPEGPVALPDGTVLVTEIQGGTIARVDPADGTVERIATTGGGPNGAALGPDGHLYVCNNGGSIWSTWNGLMIPGRELARGGNQPPDYTGGSIQVVDLADGSCETLYEACDGHRLCSPNDIVFDDRGGFYFTDSGKRRERDHDHGALYYATPDGGQISELLHPVAFPNGVGLSPAGDRVYVAETMTARVWSWPVAGPGALGDGGGPGVDGGELLHTITGYRLLDSMAVEAGGNVCVATLNVLGVITVIAPDGAVVDVVEVAEDEPIVTNICFGGADLRTAYVTAAGRGRLYATTWDRPGLALHDGAR